MKLSYSAGPEWRRMATLEMLEGGPNLPALIENEQPNVRLRRAETAPSGYLWFNLFVDASQGERRCALTAHVVLTAVKQAVADGHIEGFRIVYGGQWLAYGKNADAAMDHGCSPDDLISA